MIVMNRSSLRLPVRSIALMFCMFGVAALGGAAHAADVFTLGTGNGIAGATDVQVPLEATHDEAMQGFSVAISCRGRDHARRAGCP